MTVAIIVGSPRPKSQSGRVGRFLAAKLEALGKDSELIDLADNPLPLWAGEGYTINDELKAIWQPYSDKLAKCTSIIAITPEWGGMATPHLKNLMLFCTKGELAHKPGLIVSVVASRSGAYPVSELRSFSAKNTQLVYIPDHLIVRWVGEMLLDAEEGKVNPKNLDQATEADTLKRVDHSLTTLLAYDKALAAVREGIDQSDFPFGM